MDGSFPLRRDPAIASPPPDAEGWQREILEARNGVRARVSTKAAAHYIGVHYTTLREWVKEGRGPTPLKNPVRLGTTALNQHLGFTLEALDLFLESRSGDVITRGKRTDTEAVHRETERVEAAIDFKAASDRLAKARERAKRLGVVQFASVNDLTEVQPWARIGDRLSGHAWVVEDDQFEASGDDVFEATLEEALSLPWTSESARAPYSEAFFSVLQRAETALEASRTRQRAQDLNEKMSGSAAERKGPRPFANEGGEA